MQCRDDGGGGIPCPRLWAALALVDLGPQVHRAVAIGAAVAPVYVGPGGGPGPVVRISTANKTQQKLRKFSSVLDSEKKPTNFESIGIKLSFKN